MKVYSVRSWGLSWVDYIGAASLVLVAVCFLSCDKVGQVLEVPEPGAQVVDCEESAPSGGKGVKGGRGGVAEHRCPEEEKGHD